MRKSMLLSALLTALGLAFSAGFAGAAHADQGTEGLDHGRGHRLAKGLIHSVRANCDCGDVACAETQLASKTAAILAKLPEGCDADCQTKVSEKLAQASARILERVQAAADDPTLCEREPREPGQGRRPGRGGPGGGGQRP